MARRRRWALLALAAQLRALDARQQVKTVKLGTVSDKEAYKWRFIDKYGYAVGVGSYSIRAKLHSPATLPVDASVNVETYLDEEWPEVESTEHECDRSRLAKRVRALKLGQDQEWGPWVNG